ncbi:Hint domain-containing protein [Yoonia sp. R2331]|uniref:Hint domain-containing protein n=1 Tax=Yoonia sp. R2331 TaxID=3237238 RepID=UPI0034E42980
MKTGFKGTFVISWSQTELDGNHAAPVADLRAGAVWSWTGEAVRVDGPRGILPLGEAEGMADMRKRAALTVRRLMAQDRVTQQDDPLILNDPLFDNGFVVTDGRRSWDISLIPTGAGRKPLLLFHGIIPPRGAELWVVRQSVSARVRDQAHADSGGVVCFTPGTMIQTPFGPRDVASLVEGDFVQTQDNGAAEILWIGLRRVTGARLMVMPELAPIRLRRGALDEDVPDAGLLVSPDHRVVLRGARAQALFRADEVLVAARDLINDTSVIRDRAIRQVDYIHIMLPQHEIVFANGVATESFHPASAALATMQPDTQDRMFDRLPDLARDAASYGAYARRVLTPSEAAILAHDAGTRRFHRPV